MYCILYEDCALTLRITLIVNRVNIIHCSSLFFFFFFFFVGGGGLWGVIKINVSFYCPYVHNISTDPSETNLYVLMFWYRKLARVPNRPHQKTSVHCLKSTGSTLTLLQCLCNGIRHGEGVESLYRD